MMKYLLTACMTLLSASLYAQGAFKDSIRVWMKQAKIPGVQIMHTQDGRSNFFCLGEKRSDSGDSVLASTIFQACSMSKVVVAYAVLRLHDQELIDLDIPLMHYWTYERLSEEPRANQITARMVLAHTTGFPNWMMGTSRLEWKTSKLKATFEPGTQFTYSGEGFYFLQRVLEALTGKPLQTIVEEEVFQPLGMRNSQFIHTDVLAENYANGHNNSMKPYALRKYAKANAAYTLLTNAEDYTAFVQQALLDGKGLASTTHASMLRKFSSGQPVNKSGEAYEHLGYGLGVLLQENEVGRAVIHTGSNPGFRCFFIAYPGSKESLVYFSNSSNGKKIMRKVADLFLPQQTFWFLDR